MTLSLFTFLFLIAFIVYFGLLALILKNESNGKAYVWGFVIFKVIPFLYVMVAIFLAVKFSPF